MDAELKAKWVRALRSGNYKQAKGILRANNNAMCCLGVLVEAIDPAEWQEGSFSTPSMGLPCRYACGAGYTGMLPPRMQSRAGISAEDARTLANMNDTGASFSEIADYIEREL